MHGKVVYNPKIVAREDNYEEMGEQFEKICEDAPKVTDYPDRDVVVAHKFVRKGETINATSFADLIAKLGLNNQVKASPTDNTELSNEENKTSISIHNN